MLVVSLCFTASSYLQTNTVTTKKHTFVAIYSTHESFLPFLLSVHLSEPVPPTRVEKMGALFYFHHLFLFTREKCARACFMVIVLWEPIQHQSVGLSHPGHSSLRSLKEGGCDPVFCCLLLVLSRDAEAVLFTSIFDSHLQRCFTSSAQKQVVNNFSLHFKKRVCERKHSWSQPREPQCCNLQWLACSTCSSHHWILNQCEN